MANGSISIHADLPHCTICHQNLNILIYNVETLITCGHFFIVIGLRNSFLLSYVCCWFLFVFKSAAVIYFSYCIVLCIIAYLNGW